MITVNDEHQSPSVLLLVEAFLRNDEVCVSEGVLSVFPPILTHHYHLDRVGLIVCEEGSFSFMVNNHLYHAQGGQTVYLSEGCSFVVCDTSSDLRYRLLFYRVDPIRDILGSSVISMRVYSLLSPDNCKVWTTGDEDDLLHYISLLSCYVGPAQSTFDDNERKLLLMAFTYRLCSIHSRQMSNDSMLQGRRMEIFVQLVRLVEQHYSEERGVAFYADKLCLSPKYLSSMVKSVCGYTVQEIVFRAIIRRSIFLMKNTNRTIQQISNELHFPNASAFGTFFKRHTGLSPRHFREGK